jgi:hypothetical protein
MRNTYVCIREFVCEGILFQVGVLRGWTEQERHAFMLLAHKGESLEFVKHWDTYK